MILVTGDVVLDHNIYAGQRLTPVSAAIPGAWFDEQPGGAMLTYGLLQQLAPGQVAFGLGNVSVPELMTWPPRFHFGALWEPVDGAWRLSGKPLGYGALVANQHEYPGLPAAGLDTMDPRILVIDDGALGFRHRTASSGWPKMLRSPQSPGNLEWIILKMSRPVARGDLWRDLAAHWKDKLIVMVSADNLRAEDARISRGLSWESTVDDIVDEIRSNPALRGLRACRHLIVTLRGEAALWFDQAQDDHCQLIFDREHGEGETENLAQSRGAFGYLSVVTAALAWHLWETNPPGLGAALSAGLSATHVLRQYGHGPATADRPGFPFAAAAEHLRQPARLYAAAEVRCAAEACPVSAVGPPWSILGRMFHSDVCRGPFFGPARRLALLGPALLHNVPYGRFGKLLTLDRSEIEGLRSMAQLMRDFQRSGPQKQPLSLAVFGAPGSGKSFGLKQIASSVFGEDNPILEFNLSQFKGPEDLLGAFHQIRDHALAGNTPVAFWDEFDAGNYGWLQYFLAPMQDGTFQEGQHTHAVGKCVFVFAGGTSRDFEHFGPPPPSVGDDDKRKREIDAFRMAKGSDFRSRLAGFLDILGPNPRQLYDEVRARAGLDPWQDDPSDVDFPVRRAILLRTLLGMVKGKENQPLPIDRGLLTALLGIGHYTNGARSLEKLLQQARGDGVPRRTNLPPDKQLAMYIDDVGRFHELTRRGYQFQAQAERLAPVFHQDYRDHLPQDQKGSSFDIPWEELDHDAKEANIAAALRMPEILALAGFSFDNGQATREEEGAVGEFLERHVEFLAEEEHKGWEEQRRMEGWTYGKPRDNPRRRHPLLVPYAELPPEEKDKDRRTIRNYPVYARAAGFKIVGAR